MMITMKNKFRLAGGGLIEFVSMKSSVRTKPLNQEDSSKNTSNFYLYPNSMYLSLPPEYYLSFMHIHSTELPSYLFFLIILNEASSRNRVYISLLLTRIELPATMMPS